MDVSSDAVTVRRTDDVQAAFELATTLPDYFNASGLEHIRLDLGAGDLHGAFDAGQLIGFALYRELNSEAVELAWLAVSRARWSAGVGTQLVTQSLDMLPKPCRVCQVKTLAATASSVGYARTRRFYAKIGFIPLETIHPYPGWGPENPCQILVRCLRA